MVEWGGRAWMEEAEGDGDPQRTTSSPN